MRNCDPKVEIGVVGADENVARGSTDTEFVTSIIPTGEQVRFELLDGA